MNNAGLIGGSWIGSDASFSQPDPSDISISGPPIGIASPGDLDQAITRASGARLSGKGRAVYLNRIADALHKDRKVIAETMVAEVGKPITEAEDEAAFAETLFRYFAAGAEWDTRSEVHRADMGDGVHYVERHPRGIVALLTPWNYPVSNPCQKLAPALAAGNAVIWRPSPLAPQSALRVIEAMREADLPPGMFAALLENGADIAARLVDHEKITAISFTGSTAVGLKIAAAAASRAAAVQCEMGGKNAAVVLADADLDQAAGAIAKGGFAFAGQKCTSISRVYVEAGAAAAFTEKLTAETSRLGFGAPAERTTIVGPVITSAKRRELLDVIAGGERLTGGDEGKGPLARGNFVAPTILRVGDNADPIMRKELFGPVLALHIVKDLDEAVAKVNDGAMGLASALFTTSIASALQFSQGARTGVVKINRPTPGLSRHMPVSGWGRSGFGNGELGMDGMDFYSAKKATYFHM